MSTSACEVTLSSQTPIGKYDVGARQGVREPGVVVRTPVYLLQAHRGRRPLFGGRCRSGGRGRRRGGPHARRESNYDDAGSERQYELPIQHSAPSRRTLRAGHDPSGHVIEPFGEVRPNCFAPRGAGPRAAALARRQGRRTRPPRRAAGPGEEPSAEIDRPTTDVRRQPPEGQRVDEQPERDGQCGSPRQAHSQPRKAPTARAGTRPPSRSPRRRRLKGAPPRSPARPEAPREPRSRLESRPRSAG